MKLSHRSMLRNNNIMYALFIILLVLAIYIPALNGDIISIDDANILTAYGENSSISLFDIFIPGRGYYFRPLVELSFFLDYHLWGQNPVILHAENILIHAINSVLIFFIVINLVPERLFNAIICATLFAVHPVNSEAVCWIAGRTDPLALTFIFSSLLFLLNGINSKSISCYWYAFVFGFCAILTKETAIMLFPVSIFILWWFRAEKNILRVAWIAIGVVFLTIAGVLFSGIITRQKAISELPFGLNNSLPELFVNGTTYFGFYLSKVLFPLPLNYAITEVAKGYVLVAILFVVLLIVFKSRTYWYVLIVSGCLFLLPSVLAGVLEVAWTVVAERYMYIPMGFFSMGVAGLVDSRNMSMPLKAALNVSLVSIVVLLSVFTFQRAQVWQSNLTLFEDSVDKSPNFPLLRNELAVALMKAGKVKEAREQLDIAKGMVMSSAVRQLVMKNSLLFDIDGKSPEDARNVILTYTSSNYSEVGTEELTILRRIDYSLYNTIKTKHMRRTLINEMVVISDVLFERTKDPLFLYNNGQLMLKYGSPKAAIQYFQRTLDAASDDSPYKGYALKLVQSLKARTNEEN